MIVNYTNFNFKNGPIRSNLIKAFEQVIDSGRYIEGSEVNKFEKNFADICNTKYATGIANGTCSLNLVLRAIGINKNDEVITAPNSFIATAGAIALAGAKPVFVDICDDLNLDPDKLENAITNKTKAIIAVHLTGRPAKMNHINKIAKKHNLIVIEDAAQAVGSKYYDNPVGGLGDAACFSLHPLKNLHAYGDAGIFTSNNQNLINRVKILKNHGLSDRHTCDEFSLNCRLDELQASLLNVQVPRLEEWNNERRRLGFIYNEILSEFSEVPTENEGEFQTFQTYIIKVDRRDKLQIYLKENGVETLVHYPSPIHMQPAAKHLKYSENDFPNTIKLSQRILSLPIYPGLTEDQQNYIYDLFKKFFKS